MASRMAVVTHIKNLLICLLQKITNFLARAIILSNERVAM